MALIANPPPNVTMDPQAMMVRSLPAVLTTSSWARSASTGATRMIPKETALSPRVDPVYSRASSRYSQKMSSQSSSSVM